MFNLIRLAVKTLGYKFIQVSGGDIIRSVSAVYPYGLAGNAPKNSLSLILNVNNVESKSICIELNKVPKEALKEGEFLIGNFLLNKTIKFDDKGNIIIEGSKIIIKGPVEITDTLKVEKTIKAGGEITNGDETTLGKHLHPYEDTQPNGTLVIKNTQKGKG